MKRAVFLINPSSGKRHPQEVVACIRRHFQAPAWEAEIHLLQGPQEALRLARQAVRRKVWAVVVAGGDGTLNEVLSALVGSPVRLGLIPRGTGNGFARGMGLFAGPEEACQVILRGRSVRVDAGLLNGKRYFLNVCGVGFDALVAKTANDLRWVNRFHGVLRYGLAGLASFRRLGLPKVRVRTQGKVWEQEVLLLAACNSSQYGLNVRLAPQADPGDGLLDLVALPPLSPWRFLYNLGLSLASRPLKDSRTSRHQRMDLENAGTVPAYVHVDGEPAGDLPARIEVKPSCLRVLVP
jgi:YegS/Rv2252/BmrU family lipid kinase